MSNSFLTSDELLKKGFKYIGKNVKISKNASIYSPNEISIGDDTRIDDFCILSGQINIGKNVHIAAGSFLFAGDAGIDIDDYSGLSSRCAIYAVSDDYSGKSMTNPTVDSKLRNIISEKVIIKKHVVVGTGSTILPGVVIEEGCAIGAMSLVSKNTEPWGIYVGIPCKRIKERHRDLLNLL